VVGRDDSLTRGWLLLEDRDSFRYEINASHPLIEEFSSHLDVERRQGFLDVLRVVQDTFPSSDMYNRMASDKVSAQDEPDQDSLRELMLRLWLSGGGRADAEEFVGRVTAVEPLNGLSETVPKLAAWLESHKSEESQ
jgi:hypothetical protein